MQKLICLSSLKYGTTGKENMDTWDTKPQNNTRKTIIQNALDIMSTFLL